MHGFRSGPAGRRLGVWLACGLLVGAAACGSTPAAGAAATTAADAPSSLATAAPSAITGPSAAATPAGGVPLRDHVVVVVFENKDVNQVLGSGDAPFLNHLAQTGVALTDFHAETHPSQPNYLALFSGDTQGITDDSCLPRLSAPNLGTQLVAAGRTFVGYSEDLPAAGFTGCVSGDYAQKHSPWTAFANLPADSNQPWSAWPTAFEQLPTVAFVIPNLCNDMHNCDVSSGDRWLQAHLSDYVTWAGSHNSLLIVTFDETDSSTGSNRIVTLVNGAGLRAGKDPEPVNHYRLLRTIEAMYGLPALGHAADSPPITDIWAAQPPR